MTTGVLAQALAKAATVVARVAAGASLSGQLGRLGDDSGATPRAALIDLTHGTLRRYGRVHAVVRELAHDGVHAPVATQRTVCEIDERGSRRGAAVITEPAKLPGKTCSSRNASNHSCGFCERLRQHARGHPNCAPGESA